MNTKKLGVLAFLLVLLFAVYWEYSHITCTISARQFANDNRVSNTISAMQTAYNLSYGICMGVRGL